VWGLWSILGGPRAFVLGDLWLSYGLLIVPGLALLGYGLVRSERAEQ
jgi:hypothetical protein